MPENVETITGSDIERQLPDSAVPVVEKSAAHESPLLFTCLLIFGACVAINRLVATENVQRVHRFELDPPLAKIARRTGGRPGAAIRSNRAAEAALRMTGGL